MRTNGERMKIQDNMRGEIREQEKNKAQDRSKLRVN